jgi:hypothetical protein
MKSESRDKLIVDRSLEFAWQSQQEQRTDKVWLTMVSLFCFESGVVKKYCASSLSLPSSLQTGLN